MFSHHKGRAGLGSLAAAAGIAATLLLAFGSTTAQASTTHASTARASAVHHASTAHAISWPDRTHLVRLTMGKPGHTVSIANAPSPSNCSSHDATCTYSTGWQTYNDGGCEADVTATWNVLINVLNVAVGVQSPYLFAGCTAYGTVYFGLNGGTTYTAESYYGYACSVLDPSCSDNQTRTYQTLNAVPASVQPSVNSMWTYATS